MLSTFRTQALVVSFLLLAVVAKAQTINIMGKVEDDFLHEGLPAHISIHNPDSTVVVDSAKTWFFYGPGHKIQTTHYYAAVPARKADYLVRARLEGYGDVWQKVSVTDPSAKEIEVPKLLMHRQRNLKLGEVAVTATRIKMYYKGDTIVYNADAFKLPEGSMLDDLIRQLDGVTMNENGEIFVNGKKIDELLLGSRSFMRGNQKVLMENLPYYTVKDIKVYDKRSDRDEALGTSIDRKQYVMDVNLKKEYQNGYIANIEAAGGTEERWLGRGFLLGFTEGLRFTLMANANNVNESRHIGQSGHWTPSFMPREMLTTRSVRGEIDYQSQDKKVKDVLGAEYISTSSLSEMRSHRETFLMGRTPWSNQISSSDNDSWRLGVNNNLTLTRKGFVNITTDYSYAKKNGTSAGSLEQYDDTLTTLQRTVGMSEGKDWNLGGTLRTSFKLGGERNAMSVNASAEHRHSESLGAERYENENRVTATSERRHHSTDFWNDLTSATATVAVHHNQEYENLLRWEIVNSIQLTHDRRHDWLYHPDTLSLASRREAMAALTDPTNSFDQRFTNIKNNLKLRYMLWYVWELMPGYTTGWPMLDFGVNLPVQVQRLDYQRGSLDTLARQTRMFIDPYVTFHHPLFKGDIEINADLKSSAPELTDRITYSDTRSPLVALLGNPDLKPRMTSHLRIHYNGHFHRMQLGKRYNPNQWHVGAEGHYSHRDIAQSVSYNPQSGVYTYKPMNVSGGYDARGYYGTDYGIDKKRYWTWHTDGEARYEHSVDYTGLNAYTPSSLNKVNTLQLTENAHFQYAKDALNVRLFGTLRWRHSEGKMRDFATLNAWDYQYGINARYTLPRLNTTLSTGTCIYSRRGYGSSALNTDDLVVNASISQPFMRGKLIARLEAYDLLHNLSNTSYEVNAQGRIETWYRSVPHYVMAHLVYNWNKNPKKK